MIMKDIYYYFETLGIPASMLIAAVLISSIISILMLLSMCRIYQKAGEPGWKALIPVYNIYTLFQFAWEVRCFWLLIIMTLLCYAAVFPAVLLESIVLAVIAGILALIILVLVLKVFYRLSRAFGHGTGYMLGMLLLPVIFIPVLAFGKSDYKSPSNR